MIDDDAADYFAPTWPRSLAAAMLCQTCGHDVDWGSVRWQTVRLPELRGEAI
jgi:hypothetical protein